MLNKKQTVALSSMALLAILASTATMAKTTTSNTSARWTEGSGPSMYEKPYRPSTITEYTDTYFSEVDDSLKLTDLISSSDNAKMENPVAAVTVDIPKVVSETVKEKPNNVNVKKVVAYTNEGQLTKDSAVETRENQVVLSPTTTETSQEKTLPNADVSLSEESDIEETTSDVLKPGAIENLSTKGAWVEVNGRWFWRDINGDDKTGTIVVNGLTYQVPSNGLSKNPS